MIAAAWLDTYLHAPRDLAAIEAEGLASRPDTMMIATGRARLRVRRQMEAGRPAVILLPDGPNTIEQYDPIFERLRGRLSVVAIDPPGYGFSYATDPAALGFKGAVEALAEAVAQLGLERMVVTGPCANAYLAIGLAAACPEQTLGVIAAQATDLEGERRWVARAVDPAGFLRTPIIGQLTWGRAMVRQAMAVDRWYDTVVGPGFDTSAWRQTATWTVRCGCSNALATICQQWFAEGGLDLPVVEAPAVILWGAADPTHARSDPQGLKAYLPRAEVRVLAGAGHFPDLEDPTAFEAAILELAGGEAAAG
ncbi:MAG TPA: alpha/beta hydrolase [Phenylobacterium sp.]